MNDEKNVTTAIRVVLFNGKRSSFTKWQKKFLATVRNRSYGFIFTEPVIAIPEGKTLTDDEKKIVKANKDAYDSLVLAMDEDICFDIVESSTTAEIPGGAPV